MIPRAIDPKKSEVLGLETPLPPVERKQGRAQFFKSGLSSESHIQIEEFNEYKP